MVWIRVVFHYGRPEIRSVVCYNNVVIGKLWKQNTSSDLFCRPFHIQYCFALAFYKHPRNVHCTQHNTLGVSWDNKSLGILPMIIIQLDLTKNVSISNYFIFQSLLPYFSINETLTVVKIQNQKLSLSSVAWLFMGSMKVSH